MNCDHLFIDPIDRAFFGLLRPGGGGIPLPLRNTDYYDNETCRVDSMPENVSFDVRIMR